MFDLSSIVRENIRRLDPYSSARAEFAGRAEVWLDANENAAGSPAGGDLNRYPDPLQIELKKRVAEMNGVSPSQIFVGNGSDEAIDLLYRTLCEPGRDEVIICPPTYGMYAVSAAINNVAIRQVVLTKDFQLDTQKVLSTVSDKTKLIFICSPNNPTGNSIAPESISIIAENFHGVVAVDEAYIHFASQRSMITDIARLRNLVVLQTFSKAWGMAGLRVGLAFADPSMVELLGRVKPPYNVSGIAQRIVLEALSKSDQVGRWIEEGIRQREFVAAQLVALDVVEKVYPSDANFLLVKFREAGTVYRHLLAGGIVVRDRSGQTGCEGCLRITVGTVEQNQRMLEALGSL